MAERRIRFSGLLAPLLLLSACGSDDEGGGPRPSGTSGDCPVVVSALDCDKTQRPIVFIHGTYGSGDNIAHVASLFGSNGFCQDRFLAVDYDSLGGNPLV